MNRVASELRQQPFRADTILLTGASGYVGTLVAARLLTDEAVRLCLPIRPGSEERLEERLGVELEAAGLSMDAVRERIELIPWQGSEEVKAPQWHHRLADMGIEEIIHCAGCLDYFDDESLEAVNIGLTTHLLDVGRDLGVARFTYVSTSYSAGYVDHLILEALAEEPLKDPTYYTRSKRRAEWLVAQSGLPWLILRPSILIGEHSTGRYSGKRYGLYQQWMGLERLMTSRYHPEIHTVAPEQSLNLLHQDFFQDAFAAARAWLPDNQVCHLTSRDGEAPSMRELWDLWIDVVRPRRVLYYPSVGDVDLRAIDVRQRAYLTFAQVNLEIGTHGWRFAHDWLDRLSRERGLELHDATLESVARCQDRFVRSSDAISRYQSNFASEFPTHTHVLEVGADVASVNQ